MSIGLLLDRRARLRLLAMTLACSLFGSATQALAVGVTFELPQVLLTLKREIAASETPAEEGKPPVRIEEAQVDLDLVEVPGKAGARLVVPGGDFAIGKEDAPKPALRRRIVVDIAPAKDARATLPAAAGDSSGNTTGVGGASSLAHAIAELRSAVRAGLEVPPLYEMKRVSIDLDFALERNTKGAPSIIIFAADRRIDPKNVHKLRLKLSAREK